MADLNEYLRNMYGMQGKQIPETYKLDDIVALLKNSNSYPKLETGWMYDGVNGRYTPSENKVELSEFATKPLTTATHEMFHALDQKMGWDAYQIGSKYRRGDPVNNEDARFYDTYGKFDNNSVPVGKDVSDYRKSFHERRAFGVGNYSAGGVNHPASPHLDATNATEMAILMDLYNKSLKSKQRK